MTGPFPNDLSGAPVVIQGPNMIGGNSGIIQGFPNMMDSSNMSGMPIMGGPMTGTPIMGSPNFPIDSSLLPMTDFNSSAFYGPNNPPPVVDLNLINRRANGIVKAQSVPDDETLRKALTRQLELWSPETTLLETIYPDTVLKMTIPYGVDTRFLCRTLRNAAQPPANGATRPVSTTEPAYAVGILCWNLPIGPRRLLGEADGRIMPRIGYHYQQNRSELLATLAMAEVASNYEIRLNGKTLTIADLMESEMREMSLHEDHSMTAIGLAFYLDDVKRTWTGCFGQTISLVTLADYELNRPVYWNRSESINRLLGLTALSERFHREIDRGNTDPEMKKITEKIDQYLTTLHRRALSGLNDAGLRQTRFLSEEKIQTAVDMLLVNGHLLRWLLASSDRFPVNREETTKSIYHLALTLAQFYNPRTGKLGVYSPKEIEAISVTLRAIGLYLKKYSDTDFTL